MRATPAAPRFIAWSAVPLRAVAAAALLVLSACGGEPEDPNTVTFWDLNPGPNRTPYTEHMIQDFMEKNPDIKVKYVPVPYDSSRTKVITAVVAGSPPDVSLIFAGWDAQLAGMGALEDLTPFIDAWPQKDEIDPLAYEFARRVYPGSICYMPSYMGSDALYYRKDWFERDNIKVPTNWDELLAAAQHFTDPAKGACGLAIRGGPGGDTYTFYFMVGALGKAMFDEEGRCRLNDPEAVEGLQYYIDLVRKYKVTQSTGVTDGYRELVAAFSSGKAAMYIHNNGSIGDQVRKVGAENFMTAPLPRGPRGSIATLGSTGYVMYKAAKNKPAAWKLIAHFSSREMQSYWCKETGTFPSNLGSREEEWYKNNPYMAAFFPPWSKEANIARAPEYLPDYPDVDDRLVIPAVQRALQGKQSAQQAADEIAAAVAESHRKWREGGK